MARNVPAVPARYLPKQPPAGCIESGIYPGGYAEGRSEGDAA